MSTSVVTFLFIFLFIYLTHVSKLTLWFFFDYHAQTPPKCHVHVPSEFFLLRILKIFTVKSKVYSSKGITTQIRQLNDKGI